MLPFSVRGGSARGRSAARVATLVAAGAFAAGCTTLPSRPADEPEEASAGRGTKQRGASSRNDAPEIAKSRGESGGFLVLWPRVVPRDEDPVTREIASLLQARLRAMAERVGAGPVEVRPEPERACPRDGGCVATSLGAVLSRKGAACAVAATIGPPGTSPVRVLGWAGTVEVKNETSAFRDPPENLLIVKEWAKCEELLATLRSNAPPSDESAIEAALAGPGRGAAGSRPAAPQ